MKEASLKILFSVSSHSRFVPSTPHRIASLNVACSLTRTDSIFSATLRVLDSSFQSLSLSLLFTDGFCFLFPSPLGSHYMLSLTAFPLLSLYRFHIVYLMHCLLYALFCIPHPLWLGISQTRTAMLFAGFYRLVLSESYIFLGTASLFRVPYGAFQSQSLLLKTLLLVFTSHSISCIKYS